VPSGLYFFGIVFKMSDLSRSC